MLTKKDAFKYGGFFLTIVLLLFFVARILKEEDDFEIPIDRSKSKIYQDYFLGVLNIVLLLLVIYTSFFFKILFVLLIFIVDAGWYRQNKRKYINGITEDYFIYGYSKYKNSNLLDYSYDGEQLKLKYYKPFLFFKVYEKFEFLIEVDYYHRFVLLYSDEIKEIN